MNTSASIKLPDNSIADALWTLISRADDTVKRIIAIRLNSQLSTTSNASTDEEFFREFLAIPYDNPLTAEEEKKAIRRSHYFDSDRRIEHLYDNK